MLKINSILKCNVRNSGEFKIRLHRNNKNKGVFNLSELLIETAGFESISSKWVQCQSFETDGNRKSSLMLLMQPVDLSA